MDSSLIAIVTLVLGLAAGTALGWFFGSRPAADLRARLTETETATRELDERFRQAVKELGEASIENATLKANAASFAEQKAGLLAAQEALSSPNRRPGCSRRRRP